MAITKEIIQREVRVNDDGSLQSHETHIISEDGIVTGQYNNVRAIALTDDVSADTQLVRDIHTGGVNTPARNPDTPTVPTGPGSPPGPPDFVGGPPAQGSPAA